MEEPWRVSADKVQRRVCGEVTETTLSSEVIRRIGWSRGRAASGAVPAGKPRGEPHRPPLLIPCRAERESGVCDPTDLKGAEIDLTEAVLR